MSKIYLALEHAQRYNLPTSDIVKLDPPNRDTGLESTEKFNRSRLVSERELLSLSKAVTQYLNESKQSTVLFVGPYGGEGCSTLVREFILNEIRRTNSSILLVNVDSTEFSQRDSYDLSSSSKSLDDIQNLTNISQAINKTSEPKLSVAFFNKAVRDDSVITNKLNSLFAIAKQSHDLIVVDLPPALVQEDAIYSFANKNGFIIVVEAEKTQYDEIDLMRSMIEGGGGIVLGVILNKTNEYLPKFIQKILS